MASLIISLNSDTLVGSSFAARLLSTTWKTISRAQYLLSSCIYHPAQTQTQFSPRYIRCWSWALNTGICHLPPNLVHLCHQSLHPPIAPSYSLAPNLWLTHRASPLPATPTHLWELEWSPLNSPPLLVVRFWVQQRINLQTLLITIYGELHVET